MIRAYLTELINRQIRDAYSLYKDYKNCKSTKSLSNFSETMEWSTRWDWDNYPAFGSKALESPKKLQLGEWMIADDGEIDAESFNLSGSSGNGNNNNGGSGSDGNNKSSISASTDSSTKDGITQTSDFKFMAFDDCLGNMSKKSEIMAFEVSNNSPPLEASVGSVVVPSMALELGKRTFFENNANTVRSTSFSAISNPSAMSTKKPKSSSAQNVTIPKCLVEGCNADLSTSKEYHRKHRVCDSHSKCPKVVIGGLERRFCQQCSRFHNLSDFDEKKRSCRKRLSEHNARRRKPHQETIHFNSTRFSSSLFGSGGRQQTSFLLNDTTFLQPRTSATSTWNNTLNPKFTITKGSHPLEYNGNGGKNNDDQFHISGIKSQHAIDMMHGRKANGHLVSKSPLSSKLTNPGSVPDYGCALSLLSTNSSSPWVSSGQPDRSVVRMQENNMCYNSNNINYNNSNNTQQQQQPNMMLQTIPERAQHSSSPEFGLTHNQPTHSNGGQSIPTNSNFQLLRTVPYDQAGFLL